jgi:hypothetical protein
VTATPKIGSIVTAQLFDGRKVQGIVKAVQDTTTGQKVQIASGDTTVKVGVEQILK